MQILKTLQCGLITRTIQYKKKHIFISSLSWAFKLDGTKVFIEPEMWPIIAKYADSLKIWEEGYLRFIKNLGGGIFKRTSRVHGDW